MAEPTDFDALWNYNDPAGTEAKFRALLPAAKDAADHEYRPQLLTQIARTLSLQRRFDEAHALLDGIEPLLSEKTPVARIRWLLERGRTYNSAGQKDLARPLFLEAWETAQAGREDFYAVDAAHMLGIVETGEEGLQWNLKAIAFAEKSDQPRARGWLGSLLNNTGWSYHDLGQYDRALDLFWKALKFREEQGNRETVRIAQWCVGRCLRSLGRIEEALAVQQALLAASGGEDDGYTQEELGELLLLTGEPDTAARHFKAAYAVLSQDAWLMENEPDRMARLKLLADAPAP